MRLRSRPAPVATATAAAAGLSLAAAGLAGATAARDPVEADEAAALLFAGASAAPAAACTGSRDERVDCLLRLRFEKDGAAAKLALGLWAGTGWVAGVERAHDFDGGWRGVIHVVPEPPLGKHRVHLERVSGAASDFAAFFAAIEARAPRPPAYRWRDLRFRFFRSVGRTTPSAWASGWSVAYNVSGSLLRRAPGVRSTLFHEVFHLNDFAHGGWSSAALGPLYEAIVTRCAAHLGKKATPCLAPYAPHSTKVVGDTYYAFHAGEGVGEYAAELAVRYFDEHRAVLAGKKPAKPFKCGPPENERAWRLLADEFFGGADLVPACSVPGRGGPAP